MCHRCAYMQLECDIDRATDAGGCVSGAPPDPGPIVRLSTAYWDSQTLLTANRLRVFDVIADGAKSGESIAAALGLDPRATGTVPARMRRPRAAAGERWRFFELACGCDVSGLAQPRLHGQRDPLQRPVVRHLGQPRRRAALGTARTAGRDVTWAMTRHARALSCTRCTGGRSASLARWSVCWTCRVGARCSMSAAARARTRCC